MIPDPDWRAYAACSPPSLELDAIKRHSDRWWIPKPPTKHEWQRLKKQTAELAARHARNPQDLDAAEWALLDQVDREQNHDPFVAARAVCGPCPVRQDCLEYALANEPDVGMWGGQGRPRAPSDQGAAKGDQESRGPADTAHEQSRAAGGGWRVEMLTVAQGIQRRDDLEAWLAERGTEWFTKLGNPPEIAERMTYNCRAALAHVPIFLTQNPMVDLLEAAAPSLPPVSLRAVDIDIPIGVVFFERAPSLVPWGKEYAEHEITLHGFSWVLLGSHRDLPDRWITLADVTPEEIEGIELIGYGKFSGSSGLVPLFVRDWLWGESVATNERLDHPLISIAATFWLLTQQRLTTSTSVELDRGTRRRYDRQGRDSPSNIVVVTLREVERESSGVPGGSHMDWQHRWLVNGHWRNQWYPNRRTHGFRFIAPYVKGPPDKPFLPKQRIYNWKR